MRVCFWPAIAAVNAARRWIAVGRYVGGALDTLTLCLTAMVFSLVIGGLLKLTLLCCKASAEVRSRYRGE
jgi:ABC-type methionine transport system permease subunit